MEVRKLRKEEHIRTRKLWEEIFTEDTPEFLDYYYTVKTAENEIYVIEDGDRIVSMIHLNPYEMRIGDRICKTHYIVAVATDVAYRKQGCMRRLLDYVMQVMTDRGEPFTFLMPADEAIYKPFGFEFVYEQAQGTVKGKKTEDGPLEFAYATEADCAEMADFANKQLEAYDITTWRTEEYYRMILKEQLSDRGGILLAKNAGKLKGVFCFTTYEHIELWEPLFEEEIVLRHAVFFLSGSETEEVQCVGYGKERKPMIMAKVLQPEFEYNLGKTKVFINEVV